MSSNSSSPGYLKRDELVGKSVISGNGEMIGTVKDVVVSMDGKMGLNVSRKAPAPDGSIEVIVSAGEIQAMGDVILLKPATSNVVRSAQAPMPQAFPTSAPQMKACPRCGYVNGAGSRFCIKCGLSLQ